MFRYKAVNPAGQTEEGEIDLPFEQAVLARLKDQGYIPIRIEPAARSPRRSKIGLTLPSLRARITRRDVEFLTRELATLLEARLPLDDCLETLADVADGEPLRRLLGDLLGRVRGGASLSAALAERPEFSAFYVNLVRAGEAAGTLDTTLERLADHLQRTRELRDGIVSALIYPSILVAVAAVSVMLLVSFVLPRFSSMFTELGAALPWPTRIVLGAGELARAGWWLLPALVLAAVLAGRAWLVRPGNRFELDAALLRLPLAGELIGKIEIAKLTRTLATMIGQGVPLLDALDIVKGSMGNRVLAKAVTDAHEALRGGGDLAGTLAASGAFPKLAVQMIRVGEQSSRLEEMLCRLADVYERETKTSVQRLLHVVEPALIVGLGAIIAGIILAVLSAVLSMNELVI